MNKVNTLINEEIYNIFFMYIIIQEHVLDLLKVRFYCSRKNCFYQIA